MLLLSFLAYKLYFLIVCDDEWDKVEAEIICKKLGFPGAIAATHGSRYICVAILVAITHGYRSTNEAILLERSNSCI